MLIEITGRETLRHICHGMTERRADTLQSLKIYLHDVQPYLTAPGDGHQRLHGVKYCPYCGVDIENDLRGDE